jgi:hypothetical protein
MVKVKNSLVANDPFVMAKISELVKLVQKCGLGRVVVTKYLNMCDVIMSDLRPLFFISERINEQKGDEAATATTTTAPKATATTTTIIFLIVISANHAFCTDSPLRRRVELHLWSAEG